MTEVVTKVFSSKAFEPVINPVMLPSRFFFHLISVGIPRGALGVVTVVRIGEAKKNDVAFAEGFTGRVPLETGVGLTALGVIDFLFASSACLIASIAA